VTTRIPKTLILSSTVASSRVGASAASFCLQRLGIETVVLPTTVMGRHPGWGKPGGAAVQAEILNDVWAGVKAQGIRDNQRTHPAGKFHYAKFMGAGVHSKSPLRFTCSARDICSRWKKYRRRLGR